jgi:hypothetical protein
MRYPFALCVFITVSQLFAADWKPVTPEQLALKTAKLDPSADAEAIFWEAWVTDVSAGNGYLNHVVENYIRIKLYNTRAVEKYGDVEIPYFSEQKMTLTDIKARTIKANGSIVEVPGSAIVERIAAKSKRSKLKVKSFAMPGLEPGAIIEYQWTEVYSEYVPRYVPLDMQREIPVWEINYNVRPFRDFSESEQMRGYPFNCQPTAWEPVRGNVSRQGFVRTTVKDVPALLDEPLMPAEDDVKAWMLIYYTQSNKDKPEKYWPVLGKQLQDEFRKTVKVNGDVKQVAQEIVGSEQNPHQKAVLLSRYCQSKIRNVSYNAEGMTNEARTEFFKNMKDTHNTTDTLKLKMGTSRQILALFFALAEAAGINPVYVRGASATTALFRMDFLDSYLLRNAMVAVKAGEDIRYYNPGIPYLPPGMLDWDEQGQPAIYADPKESKLVMIPPTPAHLSTLRREATLKLSEAGSITGNISMQYHGHYAVAEKLRLEDQSDGSREEQFKKRLEARYPGAKISDLKIDNAISPLETLKISFNIEMEGYGQRTGKRIFFQPAFFQFGDKPLFSSPTRRYPISFRNPYVEDDLIHIEYPVGYGLDNADMPGTVKLGEIGVYRMTATSSNEKPLLNITRKFEWGLNGMNYFEAKYYPQVKQAWDGIHSFNNHTLTLRQK